jgi:hypothetical protein
MSAFDYITSCHTSMCFFCFQVDVIYEGEVLPPHFSLMDVAYTFKWKRVSGYLIAAVRAICRPSDYRRFGSQQAYRWRRALSLFAVAFEIAS